MNTNSPSTAPKTKRVFVWTPCILRSEDGEEQKVSAHLPLDAVLRQQQK